MRCRCRADCYMWPRCQCISLYKEKNWSADIWPRITWSAGMLTLVYKTWLKTGRGFSKAQCQKIWIGFVEALRSMSNVVYLPLNQRLAIETCRCDRVVAASSTLPICIAFTRIAWIGKVVQGVCRRARRWSRTSRIWWTDGEQPLHRAGIITVAYLLDPTVS